MKLPLSIEQDSSRYESSVLIDSSATLSFVSLKSLRIHDCVVKGIRYPQIVVHNVKG